MDLTYMASSKIPTLSGCRRLQLCQNILYGGSPEQGLACHGRQTTPQCLPRDPLMTDRQGAYFSNTGTDQMASRLCGPQVPNHIIIGDNELRVTHLGGRPEAHRDGQQGKRSQVLMPPNVLRTNICTCLPHPQCIPSISGLCLVL